MMKLCPAMAGPHVVLPDFDMVKSFSATRLDEMNGCKAVNQWMLWIGKSQVEK